MTKQEKKKLAAFMQKMEFIENSNTININESEQATDERITKAKKDYTYFFETYFKHYATDKCGWFHKKAAKMVIKDARLKAVMEWARGLGKSVHWTVGIPIWLWINEQTKFMLLISANADSAKTLLSDVQAEFEANPLLKHDFNPEMQHGSWAEGDFRLKDGTRFTARGRGQKLRGLRYRNQRPDLVVIDDADDDELSQNPARVKKVINWIYKAVMGIGDKGNFRVIIVNNRISNNSILAHFANHKKWKHLKVNAIDKNGEPNWNEKYTKEYYQLQEEETDYYSFQTEFMNNPIVAGEIFKSEDIRWENIDWRTIKNLDRIIGYWDPAYTANKNSDFNSIVIVGFKGNMIYVIDTFTQQCTPEQAYSQMYEFQKEFDKHNRTIEWWVERQLINQIIDDAINEVAKVKGYYVNIMRDDQTKGNKFSRIINMSFYFQRSFIIFNKLVENKPDMKKGLAMLLAFEIGYKGHDDFPDGLEGAISKAKQFSNNNKLPVIGKNNHKKRVW